MSLSGEYTVAPRRGPRYRWRRGGREMDGKCRTEPPALPLSEVHQEGSYLAWCRKFHDSIKFNMLQEHNLLPQNHSKKKLKKNCKGGQIYSTKNVCPRNIPMNLKIATTPFHHQFYIIQSSCVRHYFIPLVV